MAECSTLGSCTVSLVFVLLAQFVLSLVPLFFSASSIFVQLSLTALVVVVTVGLGTRCRRLIGVKASAPALVFFNVLFVWCVYIVFVRRAVSRIMDILFNGEVVLLLTGLRRIMSSDPGVVSERSIIPDEELPSSVLRDEVLDENWLSQGRVRHCKHCKAYIKGFDHHCPAFGNCIGQHNYVLFMVLLVGFLLTEASYVFCSLKFANDFGFPYKLGFEPNLAGILASSTTLFSLFQILWQALFLSWHLYCVCSNIRTDEWINWRKYPEFQEGAQCRPGESYGEIRFKNPHDKGIIQNVKELLT